MLLLNALTQVFFSALEREILLLHIFPITRPSFRFVTRVTPPLEPWLSSILSPLMRYFADNHIKHLIYFMERKISV